MANPCKDIFEAIRSYDLEAVKSFIASGTDVNNACAEGDDKGASPILVAVLSNSWRSRDIIFELIKAGADVDYVNDLESLGFTSLHFAANLGVIPAAWTLLVSGANTSIKDPGVGRTPLHYAGMKGQVAIFELMVLAGGDPTMKATDGHTAETYAAMEKGVEVGEDFHVVTLDYTNNKGLFQFFAAIMTGDEKTFADLLPKYATTKASETGWTALMVAAIANRKEMAEKLIEKGADIKSTDRHGDTALNSAVVYINVDFITLLIEKGADVNAKDKIGNTVLIDLIMTNGSPLITKKLVAAGADVNSKNSYGETPLYAAAQSRFLDLVKLLIDLGADPKMKTNDDGTVLHSAARGKNPEIIRELVKRGADLNAAMNDGWQPIHVTGEAGNLEALKVMLELGADKEAKTNDGKTVLDIATDGGFDEMVAFLNEKK